MKYKMWFCFTKTGLIRFISHLDLMRLFARSLRRASLPIYLSEGFSPHPKIAIKRALKLGIESLYEEAVVYLESKIDPETFKRRFQKRLPGDIKILGAKYV